MYVCMYVYVTVSVKTLLIHMQILTYFSGLKSHTSVTTQYSITKVCSVMSK